MFLSHFRLNALLSEAYAEDEKRLEKMKKWRDWRDKLNSKYKKTRGKCNKVKGQGIPKEPKKVQEQLEITRVRFNFFNILKSVCVSSKRETVCIRTDCIVKISNFGCLETNLASVASLDIKRRPRKGG